MDRWTEQEIAEASRLWNEGLSASQVGAKIGRPRRSVIGMAFRKRDMFPGRKIGERVDLIGKPKKEPSVFAKPSRAKAVSRKPVTIGAQRPEQAMPLVSRRPKVSAPTQTDLIDAPHTAVTILDLDSTTCRWPLWGIDENPGADGLYCGEATLEGCVYCSHHRRLGTGVGTESERRALKVLARAA